VHKNKSFLSKLKKTEAKTVFTFRINETVLTDLKTHCKRKGIVTGKLIEYLIEEYLKK